MKKIFCVVACAFFSMTLLPMANAATNSNAALQQPSGLNEQVIRPKAGISWKEKVLMQREIQKRAVARRNILLQQAERERRNTPQNMPQPSMNTGPTR